MKEIIKMTDQAKTMKELYEMLNSIAYTIGGMVCHFEQEDRTQVTISLTESIGLGLMNTSKSLGQPCSLEMVLGRRE
ncbi:hypothetical protein M4D57_18785 [Brevibacillus borstelensis]|uniref:hypothetical protein n=1 Tax=Brevibacillus borstelensis TaxID=45462 RepID=UPI0012DC4254|nr:hypothetical protein [Brevibacillus borstelensis]MCM3560615.1 hypothetical protein [Brevibacillus borstelensis]